MSQIEIEKVASSDLKVVHQIARQTFIESYASKNTKANFEKYLADNFTIEKILEQLNNPNSEFYFARMENKIIGYLKLNRGQAQTEIQDEGGIEIERIYVLKEFQGNRVGQALYERALQIAIDSNADFIWLGVWEKNPDAIRFYEKNGFIEFDQHLFLLGNEEQTDIMMKLEIPSTSAKKF